jgi:hypothetical protein
MKSLTRISAFIRKRLNLLGNSSVSLCERERFSRYLAVLQQKSEGSGVTYEIDFEKRTLIGTQRSQQNTDLARKFEKIIQTLEGRSRQSMDLRRAINRLRQIYQLGPTDLFKGVRTFRGYLVFYFKPAKITVLESPESGNATYILGPNWVDYSYKTKTQLLNSRKVRRIERSIHETEWFESVESLVKTRMLQAQLEEERLQAGIPSKPVKGL